MTLWTPGGEHPVDRASPAEGPTAAGPPDEPPDLENLPPEERARVEEVARQMAEVREQLLAAPADVVVANHAMGLYELAAIHLSNEQPDLASASLAIDAMGALVDGLGDRLGENAPVLVDALAQLKLAFVQVKAGAAPGGEPVPPPHP